jgi:hypothetical protein
LVSTAIESGGGAGARGRQAALDKFFQGHDHVLLTCIARAQFAAASAGNRRDRQARARARPARRIAGPGRLDPCALSLHPPRGRGKGGVT